ncbi:MAG TPA: YggS family pyridoxal phosphate-dependent enzyme [Casimicrobiaceae bacterium]|jgi:pyridoxal phosphate enzyme (YggS family)|nr:YggS family pyridoxal phosphate-dependent enzyme [Casimicrobiaceae bacterium]
MSLDEKAWQAVGSRIARAAAAARRDPATIRLLAVSKGQSAEAIRAAHALGQRAFGENYLQDALAKAAALADLTDIEWHLIGPLQSNKASAASQRFAWVETIDRARIAERLSAARDAHQPALNTCVQVNISGEASKSGVEPGAALALLRTVASQPRLALRGLMGIAEETTDVARQRAQFRALRELFDTARAEGLPLDTLSMGMSADLEAAIAEGATLVRIGTALFGPRIKKDKEQA